MNASHGPTISPALSRDQRKRVLYGADTFFQEGYEQIAEHTGDVEGFASAHGLLLLKPDAVAARRVEPALDWLYRTGFRVAGARRVRLTPNTVRSMWYFQWNLATGYRRRIADLFAGCTDSLLLLVREVEPGELPVAVRLSELKGPTNPQERRPGHLRHALGHFSFLLNLVHTADEPADVVRELGICCGHAERAALLAESLAGVDRLDETRELTRRLYADSPAHDLRFGPAAERLRREAARLVASGTLDDDARTELSAALGARADGAPRAIVEAVWRHSIPMPAWDVTVVAAAVFPMKTAGYQPILDTTTAADWCRATHEAVPA